MVDIYRTPLHNTSFAALGTWQWKICVINNRGLRGKLYLAIWSWSKKKWQAIENTEGGRTFSVQTIWNWSELSMDVKKVKNVKSFKKKLYTNLIAKQKGKGNFEYLLNSKSVK